MEHPLKNFLSVHTSVGLTSTRHDFACTQINTLEKKHTLTFKTTFEEAIMQLLS